MKYNIIAYLSIMAMIILLGFLVIMLFHWWNGIWIVLGIVAGLGFPLSDEIREWRKIKKEQEETKHPYLKRYLKSCGIAVVISLLACIFLWDWDGLINLIWTILAVMAFNANYLIRKMDGRW